MLCLFVRGVFSKRAGVKEAGWTEEELNAQNRRKSDRDALATNKELLSIWREIEKHDQAWLFREPVDLTEVPDYLQVVAHPMGELAVVVVVVVVVVLVVVGDGVVGGWCWWGVVSQVFS